MRLLTFTNLYPSDDSPRHGIFVEERLVQLVAGGQLTAEVVALRPGASAFAERSSRTTERRGIPVTYAPVPTLPRITNWIDPWLWARAARGLVARLAEPRRDDVILDAHFLYPDAVAAVLIGKALGLPVVMT
ncbi:MAG TPA: glycosyltransferase family 4 protein, partial [Gammaproteobacteria bacterium]|nr:glycosyltransferase family 4 protein [Gammaproteobacteria bacterium]